MGMMKKKTKILPFLLNPETDPDFVGKNRPTEPFGYFISYLSDLLSSPFRKRCPFIYLLLYENHYYRTTNESLKKGNIG